MHSDSSAHPCARRDQSCQSDLRCRIVKSPRWNDHGRAPAPIRPIPTDARCITEIDSQLNRCLPSDPDGRHRYGYFHSPSGAVHLSLRLPLCIPGRIEAEWIIRRVRRSSVGANTLNANRRCIDGKLKDTLPVAVYINCNGKPVRRIEIISTFVRFSDSGRIAVVHPSTDIKHAPVVQHAYFRAEADRGFLLRPNLPKILGWLCKCPLRLHQMAIDGQHRFNARCSHNNPADTRYPVTAADPAGNLSRAPLRMTVSPIARLDKGRLPVQARRDALAWRFAAGRQMRAPELLQTSYWNEFHQSVLDAHAWPTRSSSSTMRHRHCQTRMKCDWHLRKCPGRCPHSYKRQQNGH